MYDSNTDFSTFVHRASMACVWQDDSYGNAVKADYHLDEYVANFITEDLH